MAHDCPECGALCDCDMDDTHDLAPPADCTHACEDDDAWIDEDELAALDGVPTEGR